MVERNMAANRNIKIDLKILIIFLFFLLTRVYIWLTPPPQFTEIIYSYMPYAHLWASGVKPYLEQWYEYPPLTIPLFYIPHLIDTATNNFNWHIRYLPAYKGILTAVDVSIFLLVYLTLRKQKIKDSVITICLLYYSIATAKAHHFIYDSMDLAFDFGRWNDSMVWLERIIFRLVGLFCGHSLEIRECAFGTYLCSIGKKAVEACINIGDPNPSYSVGVGTGLLPILFASIACVPLTAWITGRERAGPNCRDDKRSNEN